MCNAWNHPASCKCGWGGENHSSMHFGIFKSKNGDHHWNFRKDFCSPTRCPSCSQEVYFIRHNGGCAWFESLGYPWPKHACFDNQPSISNKVNMNTTQIIYRELISASHDAVKPTLGIIGTVKYVNEKHLEIYVIGSDYTNKMYITSNLYIRDIIGSIVLLYRETKYLLVLNNKRKLYFRESI